MLQLPQVTLVAMAGVNVFATVRALRHSSSHIRFGRVLLISQKKPWHLPSDIDFEYIPPSKDVYEWCYKIVFELHRYIKTDYALLVHSDGFVVNPEMWRPEFLDYDYIGAPWPVPAEGDDSYRDEDWNLVRVGNSVSLRSRKILELPSKLGLAWTDRYGPYHEDGFLCCNHRQLFIRNGIKYAPLEVAKYFSHESMIPEVQGILPFAFHKWMGSNRRYPGRWMDKLLK